jgi:hypothetical protein
MKDMLWGRMIYVLQTLVVGGGTGSMGGGCGGRGSDGGDGGNNGGSGSFEGNNHESGTGYLESYCFEQGGSGAKSGIGGEQEGRSEDRRRGNREIERESQDGCLICFKRSGVLMFIVFFFYDLSTYNWLL